MSGLTFSHAHADAALCIWEHATASDVGVAQWLADGEDVRKGRDNALMLAPYATHAWKRAQELGVDLAFDWGFIPQFLAHVMARFDYTQYVTLDAAYNIGETIYLDEEDINA